MASARLVRNGNHWDIKVRAPGPDGKPHDTTIRGRKHGFTTRRAANDYIDTHRLRSSTYQAPVKLTVAELRDRWLKTLPARKSPNTVASYEHWTNRFIEAGYGTRLPTELGPADMEAWVAHLRAGDKEHKPVSAYTANQALVRVGAMFNQGVRWGLFPISPTKLATAPRPDTEERPVLTPAQMGRYLETTAKDRLHALDRLEATTGLRLSELVGLREEDVDRERHEVRVRQVRTLVKGEVRVGPPKTAKSRRTLNIDAATVAALQRWLEIREFEAMDAGDAYADSGLLFVDKLGHGLRPDTVRRRHLRVLMRAKLPRVTFHDLRHTVATAGLKGQPEVRENGVVVQEAIPPVPLKVMSERLGHANPGITLRRYQHTLPGQDQAAADSVAALIDNTKES
jgi:integrase